ncbi:nuclear transcription factor Y subunit gamma-like isoform X2 [Rhopilema esculentum]|uniref:nuclear transcription factor Y subunit gamma-like isoform X2 n=1 Tax=Rhopilema esculentum TaxID=499914 RepID=UPI0031D91501
MMGDQVHMYGAHPASSEASQLLSTFWPRVMAEIRNMDLNHFKTQELPLARIKKIMKQDEEVKMISAEAPVLFSKAAEIFISELSLRAWIHTEDNKRRTLQRNDIALAITKYDQFDFLIDIVPRDELKPQKRQGTMVPEQVQYYLQLAQMQQSQPQIIQIQPPDHQQQQQQQQHVQASASQNAQQHVQLHLQPGTSDLQQYAVQLPSGAQMQYRLVPQIIQQPGGQTVVQLQAQPHQIQQTAGGQTVIAVQPASSQQDGQQQGSEVNYSQIYQIAAAQGGGQAPIFITAHPEQNQENQHDSEQND